MLRVAFVGKGGSGKSTIAGTLARLLAARGEPVLAVDSDPVPGLALSVGVEDPGDDGLPADLVEESDGHLRLRQGLAAVDVLRQHSAEGPDGLRFLQAGKPRGHAAAMRESYAAFRAVLSGLGEGTWHVIGDLPGGTRQPFFGWGHYADTLVVVVEPTAASVISARRIARLRTAEDPPRLLAVVSKALPDTDAAGIASRAGLPLLATVPLDEAVADADRMGVPLASHAPRSPAVAAVSTIADQLRSDERQESAHRSRW